MKKWYTSKTLWVNIIAIGAVALSSFGGIIVTPEESVALLAVVNLVVRIFTKEELQK